MQKDLYAEIYHKKKNQSHSRAKITQNLDHKNYERNIQIVMKLVNTFL